LQPSEDKLAGGEAGPGDETLPANSTNPRLWWLRFFCLALIVLPLAGLAGAVLLAKSSWFERRAVPPYLQMLDAESDIHGRACEVLLFGDSTALTGLMPWVVQEQSGLTTCSVAQTKGEVGVLGTEFLDQYLRQNPRPRFLVIALAPEDWRPFHQWSDVAYVEGVLQMVRHDSARRYLGELVRHPNEAFGFATYVYKSAFDALAGRTAWKEGTTAGLREGHRTLPSPAETECVMRNVTGNGAKPQPLYAPDADYMRGLRKHFAAGGDGIETRVLLVVSPVPECDPQWEWYAARLNGETDNRLELYPIGQFNDIDRHFTDEGAERYSRAVGEMIRKLAGAPAGGAVK
jgi:hypothetical protein